MSGIPGRAAVASYVFVAVVDELQSGIPVTGAPEVQADLAVGAAALAGAILAAPATLGVVFETWFLAWTDRVDRKPILVGSLLAMVGTGWLAAAAQGPVWVALALGLWGTACGVASETAQAALVLRGDPDRAMARWGLGAELGDLLAPLLVGVVLAAGGSWRTALVLSTALPLLDAALVALGPPIPPGVDDDDDAPLWEWPDRRLLGWLVAATASELLDELPVVLGTLWLAGIGVGPLGRGAQLAAFSVGGAVGLVVTERVLPRIGARRVLLAACALTLVTWPLWVAQDQLGSGVLWAVLAGAGIAPMWPLASAAAYATRPDRPGLVSAIERLFTPVTLLLPVAVGLLADAYGLRVALLALGVQPIVVALVVWRDRPRPGAPV